MDAETLTRLAAEPSVAPTGPWTVWTGYAEPPEDTTGERLFVRLLDSQGRRVTLPAGAVAALLNARDAEIAELTAAASDG